VRDAIYALGIGSDLAYGQIRRRNWRPSRGQLRRIRHPHGSDSTSEPTPPKGGSDDPLRGSLARTIKLEYFLPRGYKGGKIFDFLVEKKRHKKKKKMAAANTSKKTSKKSDVRSKYNSSNVGSRINPSRVLSLSQLLGSVQKQRTQRAKRSTGRAPIKPLIPPKSLIIILKEKPEKAVYNRRIIDYKHCGLLQRYIGLGGKILPRRQTRLTAKQQRYIAKTIKSARVMGLLPFVSKEKGFFR